MLNRILSNQTATFRLIVFGCLLNTLSVHGQLKWTNVSDQYGYLPPSVSVFKTQEQLEGRSNIAFYVEIDTRDKNLDFDVDTTLYRRLTPQQFFDRNAAPYIVMNCSFFEFKQNKNVNLIVQDGKIVAFDTPAVSRKGKDTLTFMHTLGSAFGMTKKREMDILYHLNDSSFKFPYVQSEPMKPVIDSFPHFKLSNPALQELKPWKVNWAFGGGPVLLLNSQIRITNNEERKFAGKAINDLHPRTAIGFTADQKMILLVVQGRMPGIAAGASLNNLAEIMLNLNCVKAMNLDGGGSSTLLVNGKETIKPSDAGGQRPVPAVLVIGNATKK